MTALYSPVARKCNVIASLSAAGMASLMLVSWFIYLLRAKRCFWSVQWHGFSIIIESIDSMSRDEPDSPLTQYITNAGISRARYTITHFKHHHRVLQLISNRISVYITSVVASFKTKLYS